VQQTSLSLVMSMEARDVTYSVHMSRSKVIVNAHAQFCEHLQEEPPNKLKENS